MNEILINEKISYIKAIDNPLSSDIGIVKDENTVWLYDVGNGNNLISKLNGCYNVVLSHFHPDHIGNINSIRIKELYMSKETYKYIPKKIIESCNINIVSESINIGNVHIFPLPSSHSKGSLGMEIDGTYAFVGDALYCKTKNNSRIYNVQILKKEIEVLKSLQSSFLLLSHDKRFIYQKEKIIKGLEKIYEMRTKENSEILIDQSKNIIER